MILNKIDNLFVIKSVFLNFKKDIAKLSIFLKIIIKVSEKFVIFAD